MKHHFTYAIIALLAVPFFLRADAPATEKLVYVKPAGAADNTRTKMNKARAGKVEDLPQDFYMIILCPEHTGLTVQEHPSIFWYMNKPPARRKCRLSITTDGEPEPLLEKDVDPEKSVGIQRIDLKELAKPLEPNTDYHINLIVLDPKDHSDDLVTAGLIKRIPAPEKLISKLLSRPTPAERAIVYARGGIWYDALSAISDQIAADPKNKALHEERADLLKQGELPDAAAYEAKAGE